MLITRFQDPLKFRDHVQEFLLQHEAENNMIFNILGGIISKRYTGDNLMVSVEEQGDIVLVAIMTPPKNIVLSFTQKLKSIDELVKYLVRNEIFIPGVLGFKKGSKKFATLWSKSKKITFKLAMNEKIYKLEDLNEQVLGTREFIKADLTHESIILNWTKLFIEEALPQEISDFNEDYMQVIKNRIKNGRYFILLDRNKPVSMVHKAGKTPNGNLINAVYTPTHLRRNGYATEVVANISKLLLAEGNKFCFLFTDLSNPTSNKIYQDVGYRPIIDMDQYKFILDEEGIKN